MEDSNNFVLPTYSRFPIVLEKAEGSYVYDESGKKYLDFMSGWGVSNLGHRHPTVVEAITHQSKKLIHVPNIFYTKSQGKLAKLLVENSFEGEVFFCNSGAEANEAAIKFAKLYGNNNRYEIITFEKSFHGRTAAGMAATGQDSISAGFEPSLPGFKHVPYNDVAALEKIISDKTIAIMLEFVQGEGGINIATPEFISKLDELRHKHDLLIIADEVQTGIGRTGSMFAFQKFGLTPDIMTLAKALGGGLPVGATVFTGKVAEKVKPGMHGSTFGGGAVVAEVAIAMINETNKLLVSSDYYQTEKDLSSKLSTTKKHSIVKATRQKGMMAAIELNVPALEIMKDCLDNGLIVNATQGNVLRLLPPLNTTLEQMDFAFETINLALGKFSNDS